jgi:uncharacterized protein YjbI with pentapeptide repeats
MGDDNSVKKHFRIINPETYVEMVRINEEKFAIGKKALDSSRFFLSQIDEKSKTLFIYNTGKDNVDDNKRRGFQTIINIQSVLCLFFYNGSGLIHNIQHLKKFLKNFDCVGKEMADKIAFDTFINLVHPHLEAPFNKYKYTINPKTWKFEVSKIGKTKKEKGPVENESNNKSLLNTLIALGVFLVLILLSSYYIYSNENKKETERLVTEKQSIIENAKMTQASRTPQLISLYEAINKELKEDFGNDGKRDLSKGLIGRVVSLSESMEPYSYLKNGEINDRPLSPQRAELFDHLINMELDSSTYRQIFNDGNFSYSDFTDYNLANLNLVKLIQGISGNYMSDAQLLVTTMKRPNLKNSFFLRTNLGKTELYGDFDGSDFTDAILIETNFKWSSVRNGNFQNNKIVFFVNNSDFRGSSFVKSTLYCGISGSDFRGVNFNNCEFYDYYRYTEITRLNEFELLPRWSQTFSDVYLSNDDMIYYYDFHLQTINKDFKNTPGYSGRSFFNQISHDLDNSTIRESIVPIDYITMGNGKTEIVLSPNFSFIGQDFDQYQFKELWQESPENFNHYIVRTGDHYFDKSIYITDYKKSIEFNKVQSVRDTFGLLAGKNFHCWIFTPNTYDCDDSVLRKSNENSASFENSIFNRVSFKTKITNTSFMGSKFIDVFFDGSHLFNIDFTKVEGQVYFDHHTKLDSIYVDKKFYWMNIDMYKDEILNKKIDFPKRGYTLKDHLRDIDQAEKDGTKLYYGSIHYESLKDRLMTLDSMAKRIIINNITTNRYLIRDREYIKIIDDYLENKYKSVSIYE